jgi:hypothetical protein
VDELGFVIAVALSEQSIDEVNAPSGRNEGQLPCVNRDDITGRRTLGVDRRAHRLRYR